MVRFIPVGRSRGDDGLWSTARSRRSSSPTVQFIYKYYLWRDEVAAPIFGRARVKQGSFLATVPAEAPSGNHYLRLVGTIHAGRASPTKRMKKCVPDPRVAPGGAVAVTNMPRKLRLSPNLEATSVPLRHRKRNTV